MHPPTAGAGARGTGDGDWALLDRLPVGILAFDAAGAFVYANEIFCALAGYPREEIETAVAGGRCWAPGDAGRLRGLLERAADAESGPGDGVTLSLEHASGRRVAVIARMTAPHDGGPHLIAFEDVSEHEHTETRRRIAEAQAVLVDTSAGSVDPETGLQPLTEALVATVADFAVVFVRDGEQTIRMAGRSHLDPQAACLVDELVRAGSPTPGDPAGVGAVIRSGTPVLAGSPGEVELLARNRAHRRALRALGVRSCVMVPLATRTRVLGALALATVGGSGRLLGPEELRLAEDLASRSALIIDNARVYQHAHEAIRAREDVMAVVSHDLRGPLQTILAASQMLTRDVADERRARSARCIERAARSMHRLIRDLLDASLIEAGNLAVHLERVDARDVVEETVDLVMPRAVAKAIHIDVRVAREALEVSADRGRLLQVLANLLDNAVKFVPEGGWIEVRAERHAGDVRFAVADSGPGIPADLLPHIFDRYARGDPRRQGAGLGLRIAQGIVEAHGSAIAVHSAPGRGSAFWFVLPTAAHA